MLRRKLLIIFGSLVVLLVAMAVTAIWVLQGMLRRLNHLNTEAVAIVDKADRLGSALTTVEIELYNLQLGHKRHLDALIDNVEMVRKLAAEVGRHYVTYEPGANAFYHSLMARFPQFERHVSSLATAQDPKLVPRYNALALADVIALRKDVTRIDSHARQHARREQLDLAHRFRWLVLGMALGGILVINVAILVLMRGAAMVLRPVDKLVQTSRQLTHDHFDHRAELDQDDEFLELAEAYNTLADRLQKADQRRMEMLHQVALTLNHELNNAMATIEMQLQLLGREAGGSRKQETCLRQIREDLHRMAETVESLKHIRRIVLTDYVTGVKMLDLRRSVEGDPGEAEAGPRATQETNAP